MLFTSRRRTEYWQIIWVQWSQVYFWFPLLISCVLQDFQQKLRGLSGLLLCVFSTHFFFLSRIYRNQKICSAFTHSKVSFFFASQYLAPCKHNTGAERASRGVCAQNARLMAMHSLLYRTFTSSLRKRGFLGFSLMPSHRCSYRIQLLYLSSVGGLSDTDYSTGPK